MERTNTKGRVLQVSQHDGKPVKGHSLHGTHFPCFQIDRLGSGHPRDTAKRKREGTPFPLKKSCLSGLINRSNASAGPRKPCRAELRRVPSHVRCRGWRPDSAPGLLGQLELAQGSAVLGVHTHLQVLLGGVGYNLAEQLCELSSVLGLFQSGPAPILTNLG